MRFGLTRKSILSTLVIAALLFGSFTLGFVSSLHLKDAPSRELRQRHLMQTGDAPPAVRAGVLASLRAFQEGYVRRNPRRVEFFHASPLFRE